ncbi:MAG TPA: hypothetical protein VFI27_00865 [candidate division Zixibacteria bacterium]|nr:hypothetical protein [candidate division Zixibacteria bacterium]
MGEAEDRILKMLSEGTITAEEAEELLTAMAAGDQVETLSGEVIEAPEIQDAKPHSPPPDLSRFRRWWRIPLFIAIGSAFVTGAGLVLMYQSTEPVALLGFMCIWSIFLIALFTSVILLLGRRSTWFYIKVDEKDGSRFAFGMPMPLGLVNWSIKIARPFVPDKQAAHLETAAAFVSVMKDDPEAYPIFIDVDDEDGDKVQVFIG